MLENLTLFQMILIGSLIIILPLGLWNMHRMKKKKLEQEMFGDELEETTSQTATLSSEVEEQIKNYISQYKETYPKESIEKGILAYNITPEQAKDMVNKYF